MENAERVLIVEDDEVLLRASAFALQRAGYRVLTAAGGRDGLALARAQLPDLIVLDLLMPRPTGLEVLRTLKGEEATRHIPVLVVSNSSMQRIVEEVEGFGDEYVVKAKLSLRELAERVKRRLAKEAGARPGPDDTPPRSPEASPVPDLPPELADLIPEEPSSEDDGRPVPVDDPPEVQEPGPGETVARCAGCGFGVGSRFEFCPKCGRKLATPRSWGALIRHVR